MQPAQRTYVIDQSVGSGGMFGTPVAEFVLPLPLAACVQHLSTRLDGISNATRTDINQGSCQFTIGQMETKSGKARLWVIGTLRVYDPQSTLVTCEAKIGFHVGTAFMWVSALLLLVLLIADLIGMEQMVAPLILAAAISEGCSLYLGFTRQRQCRRLIAMVERLLREPIAPAETGEETSAYPSVPQREGHFIPRTHAWVGWTDVLER